MICFDLAWPAGPAVHGSLAVGGLPIAYCSSSAPAICPVLPSSLAPEAPTSRTGTKAGGWSSATDILRLPAGAREAETSWPGPRGTTPWGGAEASAAERVSRVSQCRGACELRRWSDAPAARAPAVFIFRW